MQKTHTAPWNCILTPVIKSGKLRLTIDYYVPSIVSLVIRHYLEAESLLYLFNYAIAWYVFHSMATNCFSKEGMCCVGTMGVGTIVNS